VLVGLGVVALLSWPMVWGDAESTLAPAGGTAGGPAREGGSALQVDVVKPASGGVRRLTIQPGSIHAFESVDLYAKVSGFLKVQKVDIGSAVKQGEVLAEIEAPELTKDVEETAAAVEQAKAQAELAAARIATAEAEHEAALAAVTQAEADLERTTARRELSEKQFERIKDLHARSAVDRKLVDEQEHDLESTRAGESAARAAIATARAQAATALARVRQAKADLVAARSAIRVAEARRDRAQVLADYTRIVAPFDGVVTQRGFHPGAFIRSAADGEPMPLLTVRRTDLMRVVVQVPDLDVPLLDVGDKATLAIDAMKGQVFHGTVARLGKSEDPMTRTMRVEIDLPNPSGQLFAGMYGRATIELQSSTEAPTVPAGCVVGHAERGQAALYVVRDGKARRVAVTTGGDDGSSVEILSGIDPDDQVIVRPGNSLEDGTPVAATLIASGPPPKH
jgi:RND family efflux transporter MFP subunit